MMRGSSLPHHLAYPDFETKDVLDVADKMLWLSLQYYVYKKRNKAVSACVLGLRIL